MKTVKAQKDGGLVWTVGVIRGHRRVYAAARVDGRKIVAIQALRRRQGDGCTKRQAESNQIMHDGKLGER
jgi:hypothetical protein